MKRIFLVFPALCSALVGCTLTGTDFALKDKSFNVNEKVVTKPGSEKEAPMRAPKAATCIAFGDFRAIEAKNLDRSSLQRQQLFEDARKAYQQALSIEPDNLQALVGLARLYSSMEDYQHAQETYEQAGKKHPKEAGIWFELGMLHARKKEWDIALEDLALAVKLEPENRQFINTYGFALCRNGKFEESYKVFIKINEPAKAHYQVARMMEHVGKKEEAREHLIKALANQPDFPDAKEMLTSLGQ